MSLDPLTAGLNLASKVVSTIWPDKSALEQQQLAAALQLIQGQIDTNKVEAANPSLFVSGWRPFVGWVCGGACAWNWIGLPIAKAIAITAGQTLAIAPANLTEMMPLLMGLLGMGTLRTVEKLNGVAAK
jgi:hypothetical protein